MTTPSGRPKKPKSLSDYLDVRLEPDEKVAFKAAAELAGVPFSVWVRERLRRSAIRELEEAGRPIAFLKDFSL